MPCQVCRSSAEVASGMTTSAALRRPARALLHRPCSNPAQLGQQLTQMPLPIGRDSSSRQRSATYGSVRAMWTPSSRVWALTLHPPSVWTQRAVQVLREALRTPSVSYSWPTSVPAPWSPSTQTAYRRCYCTCSRPRM